MIKLKRINGKEFVVNSDLIEFVEETPDTVLSLITGKKIIVSDSIDEVIEKIVEYRRKIGILPNFGVLYREDEV